MMALVLNIELPNIRSEQSVCTGLNENAVTPSVLLGSKIIRKKVAFIINFNGILVSDNF